MFRKTVIVCMALLLVSAVFAGELVELKPLEVYKHRGPVIDELDWEVGDFVQIRRFTSSAEYYLGSGGQADTMCVVFMPLAPCSIYVAQIQWFSAGSYQAFMWDYNDDAGETGRSVDRGTSEHSPLAGGPAVFGPFTNAAEGSQAWENMFTPEDLEPLGGGIEWDVSKFVVGFVKTQDDDLPQPLADDVSARRFTYTWFGGPWNDGADYPWGAYSSDIAGGTVVDLMMRILVTYTENAPPIISDMNQLPNTINTGKTCKVSALIIDGEDNAFTADLMVSINGGDATAYEMTDDDADNFFEAEFVLDATLADVFSYWVEAVDEEEAANSNEDDQLSFEIVEIGDTDATMLLVTDNMGDRIDVLTSYFDENAVSYEMWDASANKGIDEFTVGGGLWNTIFVCGWGVASMPTRAYDDSPYAHRFSTGCNFIYSDMDYFYGQGEDAEPTFSEGDFAYDCFGIGSGTNDPEPSDTAFFGVDADPISGGWVADPYIIDPYYSGAWADFVVPAAGVDGFFEGAVEGNVMALRKENGDQKSVHFAFDIFSNCFEDTNWADTSAFLNGTEDFDALMDAVLTYVEPGVYGVDDAPVNAPAVYELSQNYPNPFNPTTEITFSVPVAENVSLTVFNITGREVVTLYNGFTQPGSKSITFDATDFASGIYFYRLEAGSVTMTRKMVLLK